MSLQVSSLAHGALTENSYCVAGDAMPTRRTSYRAKLATSTLEFTPTKKQLEAIQETAEILADQELMALIAKSEIQIAAGKTESWDSVKAKLGL